MGTTPNLLLSHIAASQNQKEVTANAFADGLDAALCSLQPIAMGDANYVFQTGAGSAALGAMAFIFTGALSDNRTVFLPPNAKPYLVLNNTTGVNSPVTGGMDLTFEVAVGSPATIGRTVVLEPQSGYHLIYCDGVNVDEVNQSELVADLGIAMGDANYTLPLQTALQNLAFTFTGTLSDNRIVFLPAIPKFYIVNNSTTTALTSPVSSSKTLTFEIPTSSSPATFGRTVVVLPGSGYHLLFTDGVNVDEILNTKQPKSQVFTASGSFTVPAGVTSAVVTVVGGGGGGGGTAGGTGASGGSGAATSYKYLINLVPGNTISVTVGAGGAGGIGGAGGGNGGASQVSSGTQLITAVTAPGGTGGLNGNHSGPSGANAGTGADIALPGGGGGYGYAASAALPGGYGGGTAFAGPSQAGQSSGGAGAAGSANTGTGGGGASNATAANGGAGGSGIVIFEWNG